VLSPEKIASLMANGRCSKLCDRRPAFHHGTVGILIFLRDNAAIDPVEPAASAQHRSTADRDVASIRMASATLTGFAPAGCNLPDEHNARWAATRPFDHSVYRAQNVLPCRPKAADKGADTRELTDLGSCCFETMGTYSACFWISSVRRHRVRNKRGPPKIGHAHNTRDGLDH
jgi:hypothetical protein